MLDMVNINYKCNDLVETDWFEDVSQNRGNRFKVYKNIGEIKNLLWQGKVVVACRTNTTK